MKFVYHYKTSDGERHEGIYCAASREKVYDELKAKGVKPFGVELAPGLANRISSLGKRWMAIVILGICLIVIGAWWIADLNYINEELNGPMIRRQIYGDPALMTELQQSGFATVFEQEGERYLARFAQPGIFLSPDVDVAPGSLVECLSHEIKVADSDPREVSELKRIVMWMKNELREYLSVGVGTPERYIQRLAQRRAEEISIYEKFRKEIESTKDASVAKMLNDKLKAIGLPTVVVSEGERSEVRKVSVAGASE